MSGCDSDDSSDRITRTPHDCTLHSALMERLESGRAGEVDTSSSGRAPRKHIPVTDVGPVRCCCVTGLTREGKNERGLTESKKKKKKGKRKRKKKSAPDSLQLADKPEIGEGRKGSCTSALSGDIHSSSYSTSTSSSSPFVSPSLPRKGRRHSQWKCFFPPSFSASLGWFLDPTVGGLGSARSAQTQHSVCRWMDGWMDGWISTHFLLLAWREGSRETVLPYTLGLNWPVHTDIDGHRFSGGE